MSARTKLNIAFFNGALLASGVVGGIAGSWAVFFVALGVSTGIAVYARDIRMRSK